MWLNESLIVCNYQLLHVQKFEFHIFQRPTQKVCRFACSFGDPHANVLGVIRNPPDKSVIGYRRVSKNLKQIIQSVLATLCQQRIFYLFICQSACVYTLESWAECVQLYLEIFARGSPSSIRRSNLFAVFWKTAHWKLQKPLVVLKLSEVYLLRYSRQQYHS
jgi:hypothetical protein